MFPGSPFRDDLFAGKTALITGGATGMGKAMAHAFAAHGAQVMICSRKPENLEAAANEIEKRTGRKVLWQACDVREPEQVQAVMDTAAREFDGALDVLVNNAAGNFIVAAEELSVNGWNSVIGIVLNGTFYCSSAVGKRMIAKKSGGAILNVIANYAWTGGPGVIHSASAKAGVLAMTRTLAVEWARHKIRVNAIAPGPVDTPGAAARLFPDPMIMEGIRKTIPLRRFANLEEIANCATYILSDFASYMTGENIVIDGGQWLSGADYFTRLKQMMPK